MPDAGELVTIFADPLTQSEPEGQATLVKRLTKDKDKGAGEELWLVRADNGGEEYRWIATRTK